MTETTPTVGDVLNGYIHNPDYNSDLALATISGTLKGTIVWKRLNDDTYWANEFDTTYGYVIYYSFDLHLYKLEITCCDTTYTLYLPYVTELDKLIEKTKQDKRFADVLSTTSEDNAISRLIAHVARSTSDGKLKWKVRAHHVYIASETLNSGDTVQYTYNEDTLILEVYRNHTHVWDLPGVNLNRVIRENVHIDFILPSKNKYTMLKSIIAELCSEEEYHDGSI